jgi:hypothetical protein
LDDIQFGIRLATVRFDGEINAPICIGGKGHEVSGSGNAGGKEASSERRDGRASHDRRLGKKNGKDMFKGSSVATEKRRHRKDNERSVCVDR